MKFSVAALLAFHLAGPAVGTSPIGKVMQMLSDLQAKVTKEGETAQKIYEEFAEWCEDRAANLGHEIKTGQAQVKTLKASIDKEDSRIATSEAKIEDISGVIAIDESDLKAATQIRTAEAKTFKASEAELLETTSMLERAIGIVEREMRKGGASMLQAKDARSVVQALGVLVTSAGLNSANANKLTGFLQAGQHSDDSEASVGAPASSVYTSQSGNIVETLNLLLEEAESQLTSLRKKETQNRQEFELLKQSLEDAIRFGNKELLGAKKAMKSSKEAKSSAKGDLDVTSKDLAADLQTKSRLHHDCMARAEDFEAEMKSRSDELEALATAKKALAENTGSAGEMSYGQASFLQKSRSSTESAVFEVVRIVRDLAHKVKSASLAQLAQRLSTVMQAGAIAGTDPFAKIKGLISNMVEKLEEEAEADATRKSHCDKELAETNEKKADKTAETEKLTSRIDRMKARSSILKEEVADLQAALAKLASAQTSMNKLRAEENGAFLSNKADLEQGIAGVKIALKVLRDYYASEDKAHEASSAGESIIGLLEVVESDFTKELAEIVSTEEAAAQIYDKETKDNEIEKTSKDKDVEYKSKEFAHLDKESAELSSDRETVQDELDAVLEYLAEMEKQCAEKVEAYAVRKKRRESEIAGLKEALSVLESETALVQRQVLRHRGLVLSTGRSRTLGQ